MDFTTREDIEAPAGFVFDRFSDFAGFEKLALRRGAEVVRTDRLEAPGPGMQWRALFPWGGKPRRILLTLEDFRRPTQMRFAVESKNLTGEMTVDLTEMQPGQTRAILKLKVKPLTMTARVMLQGMRLAKGRTVKKMHERLAGFAREAEERYRPGRGR